ncbi:hypothetical protein P261_02247 [Lachnospiraceae bacterium TWA4]|nr:hypothetical protein P261_02247 [Lachnospiraceae bacterium TWA4]
MAILNNTANIFTTSQYHALCKCIENYIRNDKWVAENKSALKALERKHVIEITDESYRVYEFKFSDYIKRLIDEVLGKVVK